jgi:N-acetylmuramoyl-L-alanine amidase
MRKFTRKSYLFFVSLILLVLLPVSIYAATSSKETVSKETAAKLQIQDIRYGGSFDKTRIVLDLNQKTDFRVFLLDNPARIILDLPPVEWKTFTARSLENNHAVKSYRSGILDDGLTRIIFDIKNPVTIDNTFLVPKTDMTKDRLVIDVTKSSVNAFNGQLSRVFGNRDLAGPGTVTGAVNAPTGRGYAAAENDAVRETEKPAKPAVPSLLNKAPKMYTVVVDAGHGGQDPGAQAFGLSEKNITLAVARELRRELEETGHYKVVMTRDTDVYITLKDRVNISRNIKADLFVSVHADKISRTNIRGTSIYTLSETASDAETALLADSENNAGFVAGVDLGQESQDVADILLDLAMREKMNESNMFARLLTHSLLRKNVQLLPNSHRSAGFAVLKAPDVPSVLIETGFISNQNEAKLLTSGQFQRNISSAIVEGIDAYFRKIQALQKP